MADPNIVQPAGSSYSLPQPTTASVGDVPQMDLERTLPRQVSTGSQRGSQTITGENVVKDPTTNNAVISTSGISQNILISNPTTKINEIVLGNLQDGSYGMKVAKPGIDVLTATDEQLIFNSSQNVFKIVKSDTVIIKEVTLSSSQANYDSLVIPHGLPYTPILQAYGLFQIPYGVNTSSFSVVPAYTSLPWNSNNTGFLPSLNVDIYIVNSFVDSTYIYFSNNYTTNSSGGYTFPAAPIKYYLLQETAA